MKMEGGDVGFLCLESTEPVIQHMVQFGVVAAIGECADAW